MPLEAKRLQIHTFLFYFGWLPEWGWTPGRGGERAEAQPLHPREPQVHTLLTARPAPATASGLQKSGERGVPGALVQGPDAATRGPGPGPREPARRQTDGRQCARGSQREWGPVGGSGHSGAGGHCPPAGRAECSLLVAARGSQPRRGVGGAVHRPTETPPVRRGPGSPREGLVGTRSQESTTAQ